jgi:peptidoglycan/xylan/chitin deacetylase (PgdA/CDA1 family)
MLRGRRCSVVLQIVAGLLLLIGSSSPVAADGSDDDSSDQQAATPPSWTRSIVCPVLYTHEVPSQPLFRRLVGGLLDAGYQPASLATVDAAMIGTTDPPSKCVVLTFDDSLLTQYVNAVPVLIDVGVPAVFFVLPGFSDGVHRYMTTAQLQALADAGFEVELHTCNHANLPLLARRNLSAFYAELQGCRDILEAITGEPVDYVAYPSGFYDATVLSAVATFGFRGGFTTRRSAVLDYRSPYTLPRIEYQPGELAASVIARIRAAGG